MGQDGKKLWVEGCDHTQASKNQYFLGGEIDWPVEADDPDIASPHQPTPHPTPGSPGPQGACSRLPQEGLTLGNWWSPEKEKMMGGLDWPQEWLKLSPSPKGLHTFQKWCSLLLSLRQKYSRSPYIFLCLYIVKTPCMGIFKIDTIDVAYSYSISYICGGLGGLWPFLELVTKSKCFND